MKNIKKIFLQRDQNYVKIFALLLRISQFTPIKGLLIIKNFNLASWIYYFYFIFTLFWNKVVFRIKIHRHSVCQLSNREAETGGLESKY